MSGIVRECPTSIRSTRLWAAMLGITSTGEEWVPETVGGARVVRLGGTQANAGWYLVEGNVADADGSLYSGQYNGYPVWTVDAFFLFRSGGKWILSPILVEPQSWTRTTIGEDDEHTTTETYGDTWYETESLVANQDGEVVFAKAGKDADASPTTKTISIGGTVYRHVGSGGPAGEYEAVVGSGTRRVGHWTWEVDGGATWALNPSDRTRMINAATGAAIECEGGLWEVRRGDGGSWVAQLSGASYGEDLTASWVPDDDKPADGDAPSLEWSGLAAVPDESPCYIYQPSRFL